MFTTNRTMIMGGVLLCLFALTGCDSATKKEFKKGCEMGGADSSTCSCVYDQLEKRYSEEQMQRIGKMTPMDMDLPPDFDRAIVSAMQQCQ
ncbi:hypothetical protein [Acinetobacter sp. WCHA39]|uniref:hypothetical protein n=1 Tax=Acinetobacter sp. WCHA39 TaxID=2004648 RepID=UPI000B3BDF99|nr:hypothetical protein [Acinetobacter sp. WCHA39]